MNEGRKNGLIHFALLICLVSTTLCHYMPQDVNNNTEGHLQHHRFRRDIYSDEKICGDLDIVASAGSLISKIPFVGDIFDTAVTVATFGLKSDYLGTDCSDIPFEKIKKQMNERFDKLDKKVDRNFVAINQLHEEIDRLFKEVTSSIKNSRIQPIISGMKTFIIGFSSCQSRIDDYFNDGNFEEIENVLEDLTDAIKGIGGQLSIQVNDIFNENFAVPEDGDDNLSLLALNALYYGVQTHISVLLFLLEKRTLLAEYYYKNRDFDNYNKQLRMMKVVFSDLKALASKNNKTNLDNNVFGYDFEKTLGQDNSLIDRFYRTAELAERKIDVQRRESDKALKDSIHEHIEALKKANNEISQLVLSIIKKVPHLDQITIRKPSGELRVIGDKHHVAVTYAMQYKRNSSSYYMVSDWSVAYTLGAKQYAEIELPAVPAGTTRLIFRHIRSEKRPQLVGIIDNPKATLFKDVHRDLYNAAWAGQGSYDIAIRAIANGANVNAIFEKGRRPFHAAAEHNNIDFALALLKSGGNITVQDENGYTPLHLAAKLGHSEFCKFLMSYGADGTIKSKPEGLTPLHVAVLYKQITTVKVLTPSFVIDVNLGDKNGDTPLHYAVNISQSAVEAMIVNDYVDVNAKNNEGFTPLHFAVANKAENIVSTLLSTRRLNVNVISNNNMSVLHMAILDSSSPMTKFLLDNAGFDVDIEGPEGLRPIHFAVMTGNKHFTALLIEKGANLAALSKIRWTPLHFAITLRDVDMINMLLDNRQVKQNINATTDEGYTALHMYASGFEDDAITSKLLKNGADVDAKTKDGLTPLHIAAAHNKRSIVYGLMRNAKYEEKTPDGKLFWELAAAKDSVDVIELLTMSLTREEQKHLKNIAVKHDSFKVLKYEEELKRFPSTEDERQELLYTSIVHNSTKTSKYLIDTMYYHQEIDIMRTYKKRHLVAAAKSQNLLIVQYIMDHVNPNTEYGHNFVRATFEYVDEHGNTKKRTALHEAVYSGNIPLIKYLCRFLHGPDIKDDKGKTPADVAKEKGLQDIYRILIHRDQCYQMQMNEKVKIDTDFVNSECYDWIAKTYRWPLHYAAFRRNDIVKELLEKEGDVNRLDENRDTPLHLALANKKFYAAELIMKKNPDVRIKNNKKEKPIDLAREHGAPEELIVSIEKLEHVLNVKDGFTN